ncbi:MAG: DUF2169 domain-containing protein [Minicystis sp.]
MRESALPDDIVTALPGVVATAMAWRTPDGQLQLSVIVKATFAFASDTQMPLAAPLPIFRAEVHHGNNPLQGIRFPGDLSPYLPRADVFFTGHAYAPPGVKVQSMPVRLAIADASRYLLDKQLLVRDRDGFEKMPLTYDRAASGLDGQENPFGRGPDPARADIVDPSDPARPAGLGPISRALPARKRRLGGLPRTALEEPIARIPDGFDWAYFQAAPGDQQVDHLRGDEWIVLEGLHPTSARRAMRLPSARGAARIHGLGGFGLPEGQPLDLVLDTLHIDGEDQRCAVVFRRSFPLPHEGALASVRVVAGVEIEGAPAAWVPPPAARQESAKPPSSQQGPTDTFVIVKERGGASPAEAPIATLALGPNGDGAARARQVLPFERSPDSQGTARQRVPPPSAQPISTLALSPADDARASAAAVLPFERSPDSRQTPSWRMPPPSAQPISTLALSPADDARVSVAAALPFPSIAAAGPRHGSAPVAPGTIPAVPAPIAPPTPTEPPSAPAEPADVGVERYAAIAAQLTERRAPRADVLGAHGLTEARFAEIEKRWTEAMNDEDKRGEHALRDLHDASYVEAWEAHRGPIELADYARLCVAAERGKLAGALDSSGIRRTVWMRIKRVWAARLHGSRSLAVALDRELARQRKL